MILLVSGATKTISKYSHSPNLGRLLTPDTGNRVVEDLPWAADNAAFSGFNPDKYTRMLDKINGTKPLFVTCPDVVSDARATADHFREWEPVLSDRELPIGYVIQNGQSSIPIPWDSIASIFIGGDTAYKLGSEARKISAEAKQRGKWLHMGRVNTINRIRYAMEIGCDSIDGSGFSMFPQTHIPWALSVLSNEQLTLFEWGEFE